MLQNINQDTLSVIIVALFILALIFVVAYMAIKDKETTKKIAQLEHSIEDINKEIYKIQKWLKKEKEQKVEQVEEKIDIDPLINDLKDHKKELEALQHGLSSDREYFDNKILLLEERLHQIGHYSQKTQNLRTKEQQIFDMFNNGFSIDKISKELGIQKATVEFILKLEKI